MNSANGLPSNDLTKLVVDEEGFAWIGTESGLARFDGITVESFLHNDTDSLSIRSNYIHDIATDLDHNKIWVGTPLGVSVLNTNDKTFTNYNYDPDNPFSVPDHQAFSILKDKNGVIWIGFKEGGLLQYRPETDDFKHWICDENIPDSVSQDPTCSRSITAIVEDTQNDSILWLGTKGITRFNKYTGVFQRYTFDTQNEELDYALGSIRNMLLHSNGIIYFGTWYHGIIAFDTRTKSFWQLEPCYQNNSTPFVRDVTTAIYAKSDDEIWISSVKGLQLYNIRSNCITSSFVNDKSKKEWYSVDYIDKQDRIWSATYIDGLRIYNPLMQQFAAQYYEGVDNAYSGHTRKIIEDTIRHILIVVSLNARGIYVQDQLSQQWECILPPLDYNLKENGFPGFDGVLMDEGNVLVVADDGLFIYKPGFKRLQRYSLQPVHANPRLRNAIRTKDGYYWITGYVEGLLRLDTKKQEVYNFEKDFRSAFNLSLGGDYLVEDQNGNIWIREHNGILIYEKASGQFLYHSYDPTNIRAYRGGGIMDADEEGRVWIATQREFLGYGHADSIALGGIRYFGKKDGLLGDNVWLVKSYQGKVLVFTNKYIQVFNPKTFQFEKHFATEYGLGDYTAAASILSNDQLAIGKLKSFALFYPDSLKTNAEIPKPYISSFRVFDNNWPLGNGIRKTNTIHLSYAENFFSFEFSAIGFNLPDQTTFRYQLEGFDENWQDGTKRKFAAYTNVPGGDYRFLVEALNSEGLSQGTPSITNVHISTVWYKTIWFWFAFVALLFGLVYLIARYRITQARKEERVKSEYESKLAEVELSALRAQMNPHFIFNSLNSIEYFIISSEPERAADYLNRFSRLIRLILQNSKNTIVPLKDDLEALKLYIEMESMRFDNLFDYEIKTERDLDTERIMLPPMLLQPYVENAIWHGLMQKKGPKGKLDLTIHQSNNHLVCIIEDNGIGREAASALKSKSAERRKSYGMKITSDRLAMLNKLAGANASVQVIDLKDERDQATGTRVELMIPL